MKSLIQDSQDFMQSRHGLQILEKAERFNRRYRQYMNFMESKSLISKVRPVTVWDYYALGTQLESWDMYRKIQEEEGSLAQLGRIPHVAHDVLTIAYGQSPIAVVASVQPIGEESGSVWFMNAVADTTRGNVTAGDYLARADQRATVFPRGYARDELVQDIGPLVGATQTYAATLGAAGRPIRPYRTTITTVIGTTTYVVRDSDGTGQLAGTEGSYGSINYSTGAVSVTWGPTVGGGDAGNAVTVSYFTDFEAQDEIPRLLPRLTSKTVEARVWALKTTMGLEFGYAMRRRFGLIADDHLVQSLVSAINDEAMNVLIDILVATAQGNVTFDRTAPSGVSYTDHKQSILDALAACESNILDNAGRGTINVIVAGRRVAEVLGTLPN